MTSRDELVSRLTLEVRRAARSVAAQWPDTVEAGDLEQEVLIRLLESSDAALEFTAGIPRESAYAGFRRMCTQVASQYRNDYELFSGNYRYSGDEVRRHLANGSLVHADMLSATEKADIEQAMNRLQDTSPQYAEVIFRRYAEEDYERSDRMTLSRAIEALTREMNRSHNQSWSEHEGPATRKDQR